MSAHYSFDVKNFFSHLIFHPELGESDKDKRDALIATVALGVFTLCLVHAAVGAYRVGCFLNDKYFVKKDRADPLSEEDIKADTVKKEILNPTDSKAKAEGAEVETPTEDSLRGKAKEARADSDSGSAETETGSAPSFFKQLFSRFSPDTPKEGGEPETEIDPSKVITSTPEEGPEEGKVSPDAVIPEGTLGGAEEEREPESEPKSEMDELKELADKFQLPLFELVEAKEEGRLEEFIEEAEEIERKCHETCEKLDRIYEEEEGQLATKDGENINPAMLPEDLEAIKKVVRSAYKVLLKHPAGPNEKVEQVITITKKHRILVESSEGSFKMTGLFGKVLGFGGVGPVVRTLDILEGTWIDGSEAVLKIPRILDPGSAQIIQEVTLIKKIHKEGFILGIQKPLRLIRNVFTGMAEHCHLGPLYQTDLNKALLNPEEKRDLERTDKMSLTYQLLHGVCHMHLRNITNGDIKPGNIFCNFNDIDEEIGPLVFLSDFGGGIDHSNESVPPQETTTPEYRLKQDDKVSEKAHKENNRELYATIEKKADVFAACSVICSIFTGELAYKEDPGSGKCTLNKNLLQQLIDAGLSQPTAELIIQGLEIDYEKRLDARPIFEAIREEFAREFPERSEALFNLSQPL